MLDGFYWPLSRRPESFAGDKLGIGIWEAIVTANCRNCPKRIRERCIQESSTSPSVKAMMVSAFEAGTDTQQMWGLLQINCLLAPRNKLAAKPTSGPPPEPVRASETKQGPPPPPVVAPPPSKPFQRPSAALSQRPRESAEMAPAYHYLVLRDGYYRIALPFNGELVLGRFDPTVASNPDIDLSYEDRENRAISRRHARIIGRYGQFEIEDLGSTNGTVINGVKLQIGQKLPLKPGDRVRLGYHEFTFIAVSETQALKQLSAPAYLQAMFTGHRFPLPMRGEVIIGRSDPTEGVAADIDLSGEEDAAQVVARRHARIVARDGRHYVTDAGSATGVKLNGSRIKIGEFGLLQPGDHLWLGGCVLAYDVQR